MKYKKLIKISIISFILLTSLSVNATVTECTTSEMERLKELANNVKIKTTSEVEIDDKENEIYEIYYNIEIVNFNEDLKIVYKNNNSSDEVTLYSDSEINNIFYVGQNVNFKVYAYSDNLCTDELLKTINVKFPYYNRWYHFNSDKCEQYPDFKYCQENLDISRINYEDIDELFEEYVEENKGLLSSSSLKDNMIWYIIGAVGIVAVLTIIIVILKRKNKKESI